MSNYHGINIQEVNVMVLGEKPENAMKGHKPLLSPNDSYQKSQIQKVIRRASQELRLFDIDCPTDNFKLYTIAVFYIDAALRVLNSTYEKTGGNDISLGGFIDIGLSVRNVDDAEKTGNINAVITLGEFGNKIVNEFADFLKLPNPSEVHFDLLTPSEMDKAEVMSIQTLACKNLITYEIYFSPSDMALYTSVMVFLKSAILITVAETLKNGSSIVNLGEMFSINGVLDGKELIVNCVPGADGKLIVKSDGATEDE